MPQTGSTVQRVVSRPSLDEGSRKPKFFVASQRRKTAIELFCFGISDLPPPFCRVWIAGSGNIADNQNEVLDYLDFQIAY